METNENDGLVIKLDIKTLDRLSNTILWMRFVSISGYVFCGISFFMSFFSLGSSEKFADIIGVLYFIFFLIVAGVLFLISQSLFRYQSNLNDFLELEDGKWLGEAFFWQKRYWLIAGVVTLINVVLVVIVLIANLFV